VSPKYLLHASHYVMGLILNPSTQQNHKQTPLGRYREGIKEKGYKKRNGGGVARVGRRGTKPVMA